MNTLELVTTETMIDELKRRFPVMVFAGVTEWDDHQAINNLACSGDVIAVMGLLHLMDYELMDRMIGEMHETDERL